MAFPPPLLLRSMPIFSKAPRWIRLEAAAAARVVDLKEKESAQGKEFNGDSFSFFVLLAQWESKVLE